MKDLWYLASPYARYHAGRQAAADHAAEAAALCLAGGIAVFAPICHSHPIDQVLKVPADEAHRFWLDLDRAFMERCTGCIVLKLPGWSESKGIAEELAYFHAAGKPIVFMIPGAMPAVPRCGG